MNNNYLVEKKKKKAILKIKNKLLPVIIQKFLLNKYLTFTSVFYKMRDCKYSLKVVIILWGTTGQGIFQMNTITFQ